MIRHDVINNHLKITIKLSTIITFQPLPKLVFSLLLPDLTITEFGLNTKVPSTAFLNIYFSHKIVFSGPGKYCFHFIQKIA